MYLRGGCPRRPPARPPLLGRTQSQIDQQVETHLYRTDYRSLYGGMVELPLMVTRDDGSRQGLRWFADRDLLTSGRLRTERDAEFQAAFLMRCLTRICSDGRSDLLGEFQMTKADAV